MDDTSIASLTDDGQGNWTLTALAAGTATLTGTSGTRSGTATVTVVQLAEGGTLPAGTKRWVSPPLGPRTVQNIVQARVVDENTPDFYVQESAGSATSLIRAFTALGQQKWVWPADSSQQNPSLLAGDNNGGLLALTEINNGTAQSITSISQAGSEAWSYSFPGIYGGWYAVAADNTVFVLRTDETTPYGRVVALDGTNGQERYSVSLPTAQDQILGGVGGFVIDGDGALWTSVAVNTAVQSPQWSCTSTLYSVRILDGNATFTPLDSASFGPQNCGGIAYEFAANPAVIPDGSGGALFSALKPSNGQTLTPVIYRSSGTPIASPVGTVQHMLLGEDDELYATGNLGAVGLLREDVVFQTTEVGEPVLAADDGTLVLQKSDQLVDVGPNAAEVTTLAGLRLAISTEFLGIPNLWTGRNAAGALMAFVPKKKPALGKFVTPTADASKSRMADPALKLVATKDCSIKSQTGPPSENRFNYDRYLRYELRQADGAIPGQQYIVYEILRPYKSHARCTDPSTGEFLGMSPCVGDQGLDPNQFADHLAQGIGDSTETWNNQEFHYDVPGRWPRYPIRRIERTLASGQKVPKANYYNVLHLKEFAEPLIDEQPGGYLAPWDGNSNTCSPN